MTAGHSNALPPRWAEALLRLLLRPADRETVSGDLLEEYRDTIVPALGSAADRWYIRQVGWFLFRSSRAWGGFIGAALVIRYLLDTLVPPPGDYRLRAAVLSYTIIGAALSAGFGSSWRTRSIKAGALIATGAGTLGALISIVGTAAMLAVWHDPATLDAWRRSGGLDEAFIAVPLDLVAIGAIFGFAGALSGKFAAALFARVCQKA